MSKQPERRTDYSVDDHLEAAASRIAELEAERDAEKARADQLKAQRDHAADQIVRYLQRVSELEADNARLRDGVRRRRAKRIAELEGALREVEGFLLGQELTGRRGASMKFARLIREALDDD